MSATPRDEILARVRRLQPAARDVPELPPFARGLGAGPFERFAASLQRMGGKLAAEPTLDALLQQQFPQA